MEVWAAANPSSHCGGAWNGVGPVPVLRSLGWQDEMPGSPYGMKAVANETRALAAQTCPGRHDLLYRAAKCCVELIAGGEVREDWVRMRLRWACKKNGLWYEPGRQAEFHRVVRDGFMRRAGFPRSAKHRGYPEPKED
jgi:hypothetical protein